MSTKIGTENMSEISEMKSKFNYSLSIFYYQICISETSSIRQDIIAWVIGMLFIFLIIGLSWVWGKFC